MKKELIIVTGATGVGKTDFVDELILKLVQDDNRLAEIINIDMGQFYEPLSIGTAKPVLRAHRSFSEVGSNVEGPDYKKSKYKQHLFNIVKEPVNFTVTQYRKLVLDKIEELWAQGVLPILVGGSAFYIKSLFFPPKKDYPNYHHELITKPDFDQKSTQELWHKLNAIDPERAKKIDSNDRYRIERALTIWYESGKKPSEFGPEPDIFADKITLLILDRDRNDLYERINKRTVDMLDAGWVDEVKNLGPEWTEFLKKKKLIGYDDIILFLEKKSDQKSLVEKIQQKTRNYAKRQLTFYRKLTQELEKLNKIKIEWINLDNKNFSLCIDQLLDKIL